MNPDNQALQVFYGTIPLMLLLLGIYFRELITSRDVLARLRGIEENLGQVVGRLIVLETRAGVVYQGK